MAQPTYERKPWVSAGKRVESTVPAPLVDSLGIEGGQPAGFRPLADGTELPWRVTLDETVETSDANARNIKHRAKSDDASEQFTIRVPVVLAAMSGLTGLVQAESPTLEYEPAENGVLLRTWPPLRPWAPPADEPAMDVPGKTGRLVELPHTYFFEVATEQARALDLEKGQPVAFRFTVRDGGVAVVADLDVERTEEGGPHIRRVQRHQSGAEGREIDQYRIYVPRAAVHALGWQDSDIRFEVEHDRLVLSRATATSDDLATDEEDVQARESGGVASASSA